MIIKINSDYYVDLDDNSYNVHHVSVQQKDSKKATDKVLGYCSNLDRAIKTVIQHKMALSKDTLTLDEFLARWKGYNDSLSKFFAKINLS
jgi:hypothetical protein